MKYYLFYIYRVGDDSFDIHADSDRDRARDLANPDAGDALDYALLQAEIPMDACEARFLAKRLFASEPADPERTERGNWEFQPGCWWQSWRRIPHDPKWRED